MADKTKPAPQTDFWAGTAAPPQGAQDSQTAPQGGNDDYKVWLQGDGGNDDSSDSLRVRMQKSFDKNTQTNPNEPLLETGLKSVTHAIGQPFLHPLESYENETESFLLPALSAYKMAKGQYQDYKEGGLPYAATKMAGGAFGNTALGAAAGAAPGMRVPEPISGYKSPVIDPALQNASKLATAIRPVGGIPHGLEADIATELPKIKGFAQQAGNPMHSQWEAAQAARQSAEQGLQHYKENILGPNKDALIRMADRSPSQGFVGPRENPEFMSLESIENRLSEINDLMRPAGNAKTVGASMTALERQGLEGEANVLRNKLYQELGQRTGLPPEGIKGMRESYGRQFGIADTIDAARRARLGPKGASAEGASLPMSKTGLMQSLVPDTLKDYLANRNFRKAAEAFEPQTPEYPQPQYPQKLQGDQFNNPFLNRRK
jgi:hypothetical protein